MSNSLTRVVAITSVVGLFTFGGGYVVAAQPHMHSALDAPQSARSQLEQALPDKAGHRVRAEELVEDAITQVRAGIAAGAN